jgi:HK97 family phage prohead protease
MPYFIEDDNPDCSGWATVKEDGEVMGCHQTKADAIDQMVALSIAEGIDPGGERSQRDLPDAYRPAISDDVPEGRACGNCAFYDESMVNEDGQRVWCSLWEDWVRGDFYCDRWEPGNRYMTDDDDEDERAVRQVELDLPRYISAAAARGLDLRADGFGGDGVTDRTVREARAMANGDISEDKVIRANAWAARHAVDLDAPSNSNDSDDGWPGAGAVAHYLWGIDPLDPDPARNWFSRKAEEIQAERQKMTTTEMRQECIRRVEFRAAPSTDGLTLEGYAAVFDEWTDINDYEGSFRERIAPGAFKRTLGQRMPVLQFDHGSHPLIGSIPLGRITSIVEDSHGLRVKARLSDNWLVEPVRDAIRDGAISGMSFRFRVVDDNWTRTKNGIAERTIREVELYEVGPVVFPAYEQTTVGVRSKQALSLLQDPEIRGEIARMLISGTDVEQTSPAFTDGPADSHPSEPDTPVERHVSIPNLSQRRARLVLAGITKE